MIYACSDIHGRFDRYEKALSRLKGKDKLYILGDVIDRGNDGFKILCDIFTRPNVHLILGNHESFLFQFLCLFFKSKNEDMSGILGSDLIKCWTSQNNGGVPTLKSVLDASPIELIDVLNHLYDTPIFRRVAVNGRMFYLGHACSLKKYSGKRKMTLREMLKQDFVNDLDILLWKSPFRPRYQSMLKELDVTKESYVFGHVPIQNFTADQRVKGYLENHLFDIDGGCAYGDALQNWLVMFCLDTLEAEYID